MMDLCYSRHPSLHSFPTRRSSDLHESETLALGEVARVGAVLDPGDQPVEQATRRTGGGADRKSTRLNSSHVEISYAVFCLKKKKRYILIRRGGSAVAGSLECSVGG